MEEEQLDPSQRPYGMLALQKGLNPLHQNTVPSFFVCSLFPCQQLLSAVSVIPYCLLLECGILREDLGLFCIKCSGTQEVFCPYLFSTQPVVKGRNDRVVAGQRYRPQTVYSQAATVIGGD